MDIGRGAGEASRTLLDLPELDRRSFADAVSPVASARFRLGGILVGGPAAVASPSGRLDVFVRGIDDALYHRWSSGSGLWSAWERLGGRFSSSPTAVTAPVTGHDVVVRGDTGRLYATSSTTGWASW